jgi:ribulose-5-phosphate 4-epimerase/fuculose-1-phosphate aldolase
MAGRDAPRIPDSVEALSEEVVLLAGRLVPDGLAIATAGNVSGRDPASGLIAVTPAGRPYAAMTAADIALVDREGKLVRGPHRPTSELPLHLALYAHDPRIAAIVHTHSPYAAAFSVARHPIPLVCNEGLWVGAPRVEVTEFAPPGTAAVGRAAVALVRRLPGVRAFLLANHGVVALGPNLASAYDLAAQVEWEARVYHLALQLGEPHVLTKAQMDQIVAHYAKLPPVERSAWGEDT